MSIKRQREPKKCRLWEHNRRERLNKGFTNLSKTLPSYDPCISFSKIEIIQKATSYIDELKEKNSKLLTAECSKANLENIRNDELKMLEERISVLLKRNEQLVNLLKSAGIQVPSELDLNKVFSKPKKWSNKINEEQALELRTKINENKKDSKKTSNVSKLQTNQNDKISKSTIIEGSKSLAKKEKSVKTCSSRPIVKTTISRTTGVTSLQGNDGKLVKSATSQSKNSFVTNTTLLTTPIMATKIQRNDNSKNQQHISTLGPGTLILANGTICPILPVQNQTPTINLFQPQPTVITAVVNQQPLTQTVAVPTKNPTLVLVGNKEKPTSDRYLIQKNYQNILPNLPNIKKKTIIRKVLIPKLKRTNIKKEGNKRKQVETKENKIIKDVLKERIIEEEKESKKEDGKDDVKSVNEQEKENNDNSNKNTEKKEDSESTIPTQKKTTTSNYTVDSLCHSSKSHVKVSEQQLSNEVTEKLKPAIGDKNDHPDLSTSELFASLQIPHNVQSSTESMSPTAAFLLAFPLVSTVGGGKITEVPEDDHSEQDTPPPTLLQIGNMEQATKEIPTFDMFGKDLKNVQSDSKVKKKPTSESFSCLFSDIPNIFNYEHTPVMSKISDNINITTTTASCDYLSSNLPPLFTNNLEKVNKTFSESLPYFDPLNYTDQNLIQSVVNYPSMKNTDKTSLPPKSTTTKITSITTNSYSNYSHVTIKKVSEKCEPKTANNIFKLNEYFDSSKITNQISGISNYSQFCTDVKSNEKISENFHQKVITAETSKVDNQNLSYFDCELPKSSISTNYPQISVKKYEDKIATSKSSKNNCESINYLESTKNFNQNPPVSINYQQFLGPATKSTEFTCANSYLNSKTMNEISKIGHEENISNITTPVFESSKNLNQIGTTYGITHCLKNDNNKIESNPFLEPKIPESTKSNENLPYFNCNIMKNENKVVGTVSNNCPQYNTQKTVEKNLSSHNPFLNIKEHNEDTKSVPYFNCDISKKIPISLNCTRNTKNLDSKNSSTCLQKPMETSKTICGNENPPFYSSYMQLSKTEKAFQKMNDNFPYFDCDPTKHIEKNPPIFEFSETKSHEKSSVFSNIHSASLNYSQFPKSVADKNSTPSSKTSVETSKNDGSNTMNLSYLNYNTSKNTQFLSSKNVDKNSMSTTFLNTKPSTESMPFFDPVCEPIKNKIPVSYPEFSGNFTKNTTSTFQKPPVNWMTTPDLRHQNLFENAKISSYPQSCHVQPWNKFLENSMTPSTLPMLIGDLALNPTSKDQEKKGKDYMESTNISCFSVSQLVDHGKPDETRKTTKVQKRKEDVKYRSNSVVFDEGNFDWSMKLPMQDSAPKASSYSNAYSAEALIAPNQKTNFYDPKRTYFEPLGTSDYPVDNYYYTQSSNNNFTNTTSSAMYQNEFEIEPYNTNYTNITNSSITATSMKNYSKKCRSNPKRAAVKRKHTGTELPQADFGFLSNLDDSGLYSHGNLFPPANTSQSYSKNDLACNILPPPLPPPPPVSQISRTSNSVQHSPCTATGPGGNSNSLTNFNLSTIFPEINKPGPPGIFANSSSFLSSTQQSYMNFNNPNSGI